MGNLGDRIKRYEAVSNHLLLPRMCTFIRVDGRAFHSFTHGAKKPFDQHLMDAMDAAAWDTAKEMMGFKLAYVQSDEATFMLTDFDRLDTQPWFGGELNKVVSLTASIFTGWFNFWYQNNSRPAAFDARAFSVPTVDAPNVFVWRQQDWERNSLQMLARAHFSHKECLGKGRAQLHEMLHTKGINWATDCSEREKNGMFYLRDGSATYSKCTFSDIANMIQAGFPQEAPA